MWGFITGGLVWFSIPFTLATTMGLAYLGLSSAQGQPMLSDEDVMKVNTRAGNETLRSLKFCEALVGAFSMILKLQTLQGFV